MSQTVPTVNWGSGQIRPNNYTVIVKDVAENLTESVLIPLRHLRTLSSARTPRNIRMYQLIRHACSGQVMEYIGESCYGRTKLTNRIGWRSNNPADGQIDGAQIHMLSYLGESWRVGAPRFSAEQAIGYAGKVTDAGGQTAGYEPTISRGVEPRDAQEW